MTNTCHISHIYTKKNADSNTNNFVSAAVKKRGGVASNLEPLPDFRAPCEGGLGPCENADSVHAKKLHGKGTRDNKQHTDEHRDYQTESALWADSVKKVSSNVLIDQNRKFPLDSADSRIGYFR